MPKVNVFDLRNGEPVFECCFPQIDVHFPGLWFPFPNFHGLFLKLSFLFKLRPTAPGSDSVSRISVRLLWTHYLHFPLFLSEDPPASDSLPPFFPFPVRRPTCFGLATSLFPFPVRRRTCFGLATSTFPFSCPNLTSTNKKP